MTDLFDFDNGQRRIRRARAIICYWKDGRLFIENYLSHVIAGVDPGLLRVLHVFDAWQSVNDASQVLSEYSPAAVREATYQLLKRSFLIQECSEEAERDEVLARVWADWLPHGCFHFATKDVAFLPRTEAQQLCEGYFASSPPPIVFKTYDNARRLVLPKCAPPDGGFPKLLAQRRTHRTFGASEVPLSKIAQLLFYTWGVVRCEPTRFGPQVYKTSPSGGARHPIEAYVVALRVQGLEAGIYHYNFGEHSLELIRQGPSCEHAVKYCAGQEYVRDAAALFLMTAVFQRSMWKYRFARAYRVVTLDAGHLGQTFCLLATQLGLAPFCTAALNDSLIEAELGLDGVCESPIYLVGVGTLPT